MTDQELYEKAYLYGKNALLWRQKFTGLLPEIEKRRLYEKKGFGSVFEFAFKLAGLSEKQVKNALNLGRSFSDKPALKALLEKGEVSVHKLVRVQSVATVDSEAFWAEQVKLLPKKALETLVRDERAPTQNASLYPQGTLPGQRVELSESVQQRLAELQAKGLDVNGLLTEFLDKREEEIEREKEVLATQSKEPSSYVPVAIRRLLQKEHGKKCSIPNCKKPSQEIHHTRRFSLVRSHDPHYLAPLCKEHHQLAHLVDQSYREIRARV